MNNMDSDFKNFLKRECKKKDKATHVVPNIGSFTIEKKNMERFQNYCYQEFFENDKKYQITMFYMYFCNGFRFEIQRKIYNKKVYK